jgi:TPR repeat protein
MGADRYRKSALIKLRLAAIPGDAQAQYNLGRAHDATGRINFSGDSGEAAKWYRKAADQGHVRAQVRLAMRFPLGGRGLFEEKPTYGNAQFARGAMYHNGNGVPSDSKEAAKWFWLAADQGHVQAQYHLALLCFGGRVPQDYKQALKWWRLAAYQGDATAQFGLGVMCATGQGVPQDLVQSYAWYSLAAADGFAPAKNNKGFLAEKMTSEQIARAQELSTELDEKINAARNSRWNWMKKCAHLGVISEEAFLAQLEQLRLMADQGHAYAQANLGAMYAKGNGVPQDYVQADAWYNLASANGHANAKHNKDLLIEKMTPEQIARAQELARELDEKINRAK